jgi:pimeloyl-ACP methyl ester carboxylesterase
VAAIAVPVRAVHGEHASEHQRRASAWIAERLADQPPIEIAGAGHHGPFTHPDAVAAIMRSFVRSAA